MQDLSFLKQKFDDSISDIDKVASFGSEHSRVLNDLIGVISVDLNRAVKGTNSEQKVNNVLDQIKKLDEHPELKPLSSTVYGQSVALIVSAFESSMNDLFIFVIDKHPSLIKWPEKEIKISTDLIQFGFDSLGEFLLKNIKEKINFQNIEDVKRFLSEYFKISISSLNQEETDSLIFYSQLRHLVVHNASVVDKRFSIKLEELKHINTVLIGKTVCDTKYPFDLEDYKKAKEVFSKFFQEILSEIENKLK